MKRTHALVLLAMMVACGNAGAHAPDEVYVWQRHWTPALRDALTESRDLFGGVRVLVAQAGANGRWVGTDANPSDFAGDARRVTAVVRFDGASSPPDPVTLRPRIERLIDDWRAGGVALSAIEIDYDCGSARLADYAQRLQAIKASLPSDVRLSITALPAWTDARALDAVLAAADSVVLQLHAVDNPQRGLFDSARAETSLRTFARRADKDFSIALPAYGSRVRFGTDGRAIAVESEMPVDAIAGDDARDLAVDPATIVAFLQRVAAEPPPHLHDVVWFRLPVAGDRRAWTLAGLREVIDGRVPHPVLRIDVARRDGGVADLVLTNAGSADGTVRRLHLAAADCSASDASIGWRAEPVVDGWRFVAQPSVNMRAGTRRTIGWVRCTSIGAAVIDEATGE